MIAGKEPVSIAQKPLPTGTLTARTAVTFQVSRYHHGQNEAPRPNDTGAFLLQLTR